MTQGGRIGVRLTSFVLGLCLAALEGLTLLQARAATARVSATILAPSPAVSVVNSLPPEVSATGTVLVHMESALTAAPEVRMAEPVSAAEPAVNAATMLGSKAGDGTLKGSGMTAAVTAVPSRIGPAKAAGTDTVRVLVEFN